MRLFIIIMIREKSNFFHRYSFHLSIVLVFLICFLDIDVTILDLGKVTRNRTLRLSYSY